MKTLLVGIAFAMGMVFASQAFALPYCPNHTWQKVTSSAIVIINRALLGGKSVSAPNPPDTASEADRDDDD